MLSRFVLPLCLALFPPAAATAQDLLPVEHFARLPMIGGPGGNTNVALSPDGTHYAAIISLDGEPALASIPTDGSTEIKATKIGEYQPRWFRWANDRHLLLSAAFPARRYAHETLETRLAMFDIETGILDNLIRFRLASPRDAPAYNPQFQDNIVSRLPVKDNEVMVALDREEPGLPGVFRFSLSGPATGNRVLRYREGIQHWRQDSAGVIRLGYGYQRMASGYLKPEARLVFRASDADEFSIQATFDPRDMAGDAFGVIGFTAEPNVILISDLNEHGRLSIFTFDMSTAKVVGTIFSNEKFDVTGAIFAPGSDRLVGVAYVADAPSYVFFDDQEREDQTGLGRGFPGLQVAMVSRDAEGTKAIARTESPSVPPEYHYLDMARSKYARLGSAYPQLAGITLSETRPISYTARDGLAIDGYLTVPKGADPRNLPLIVHPHGGPAGRDTLSYDYWVQYFASRGWAVLQMNFRGSTGYGDAFERAGEHEWGKAMQDDVTDGVRWAIGQGIADPARICVVGASYGGYVALQGAASTPELYRCAVSLNGVSDIRGLIRDSVHYSSFLLTRDYLSQDDPTAVSPAHHADKITAPVLVAYSTKDRNVEFDQSTGMITALKRAGKAVVEVRLEDADHYLTHERHRLAFFKAMDAFLLEHLGPGPVPSSQASSSRAD